MSEDKSSHFRIRKMRLTASVPTAGNPNSKDTVREAGRRVFLSSPHGRGNIPGYTRASPRRHRMPPFAHTPHNAPANHRPQNSERDSRQHRNISYRTSQRCCPSSLLDRSPLRQTPPDLAARPLIGPPSTHSSARATALISESLSLPRGRRETDEQIIARGRDPPKHRMVHFPAGCRIITPTVAIGRTLSPRKWNAIGWVNTAPCTSACGSTSAHSFPHTRALVRTPAHNGWRLLCGTVNYDHGTGMAATQLKVIGDDPYPGRAERSNKG
ncbi:hypothetical protein C8R43DRAFT_944292 [Mycena crocata]|nr:hypothetical protein C8R43DRAFT_944292 [Mycena crocata]